MCGATIEALTVVAYQDRPFTPLADRKIDGACGTWDERDHCRLVAFAEDPECAVSSVEAEVADVGLAGFADPQPVEAEQHGESGSLVAELFGGEQEPAEFGAVQPVALARVDLRAPDVLCRVRPDPAVDVREPVQPTHRRQPPVDRRGSETSLFHVMTEQLDVRACRREDLEADRGRPREEEAQILPIRLQRSAAVAGEERDCCEFGFVHLPLNEYLIEPDPIR